MSRVERPPTTAAGIPTQAADSFAVHNPAHPDEVVGWAPVSGAAAGREAISAAVAAQHQWTALTPADRLKLLQDATAFGDDVVGARAELLTRENGKVIGDARGECRTMGGKVSEAAGYLTALDSKDSRDDAERVLELRKPFGVVVAIVPSNWPVGLTSSHLIPALVAGNTVVVKLPRECPLAADQTLAAMRDRLPDGVLHALTGNDEDVTRALLQDRRVGGVGFTGSVATAVRITQTIEDVKRLVFELGGNDAAIVCADADLSDIMIDRMARSALRTSGQFCVAIKRVYVHRTRYDELRSKLAARFEQEVVGDGLCDGVTLGPLISARARDYACSLVAGARAAGAEVLEFGSMRGIDAIEDGYFVRPTLVFGAAQDSELVSVEQFAPVLPVLPVDSDAQAIEWTNQSRYGLSGSVWSGSEEHALEVAAHVDSGSVLVNSTRAVANPWRLPFGGAKQSGVGRLGPLAGLLSYSEPQHNVAMHG